MTIKLKNKPLKVKSKACDICRVSVIKSPKWKFGGKNICPTCLDDYLAK